MFSEVYLVQINTGIRASPPWPASSRTTGSHEIFLGRLPRGLLLPRQLPLNNSPPPLPTTTAQDNCPYFPLWDPPGQFPLDFCHPRQLLLNSFLLDNCLPQISPQGNCPPEFCFQYIFSWIILPEQLAADNFPHEISPGRSDTGLVP